jgi:hypothetical protein
VTYVVTAAAASSQKKLLASSRNRARCSIDSESDTEKEEAFQRLSSET